MKQSTSSWTRGHVSLVAIAIVVTLVLIAVVGLLWRGGSSSATQGSQPDVFAVKRGSFDITIPVSGELAALDQIVIRNNLDGRSIITDIVAEGTVVQSGDVLMRLNDEEIRNKLRDAQDRVNVAEAAGIAAQAKLDIQKKTREAELAKADLAIKLADLALKAWQEGEAAIKLKELDLALETAEKEYVRLEDRFKESAGLLEKNFISKDEFKRDEIAWIKAKSDREKAILNLEVYKKYQFEQDKAQKESDLDQAKSERERVEQENDAEVRSAQSDLDSKTYQLGSAKEKLAELQQQLVFCTVTAPSPGLVVYFASTQTGGMGRNEGRPPQVGTELTRNEQVIILPDTSQMIAAVKISEALVGQIQPGQRASVTCDAMPERPLAGEVLSVGVLAESGGWRDPNRRDYTVRILLRSSSDMALKPSMRCKANIHIGRVDDALYIPVQAVSRAGPVSFVYVPEAAGFAQHKLVTGRSSELYAEVTEGLTEGQVVLLRQPQPEEIISRLPIPKSVTEQAPDEGGASLAGGERPSGMPGPSDAAGGNNPMGGGNGSGNGMGGGRPGGGGLGAGNFPGGGQGRPEGGRMRRPRPPQDGSGNPPAQSPPGGSSSGNK